MKTDDYIMIGLIIFFIFFLLLGLIIRETPKEKCFDSNKTYIGYTDYSGERFEYCGDVKDITYPISNILSKLNNSEESQ